MTNKFTPEVADHLLDKLSTDDAFRELFQSNPRAALEQVGHVTSAKNLNVRAADPVMCCSNLKGLASKEAIHAGRVKLRAALTSLLPQAMFDLCAS